MDIFQPGNYNGKSQRHPPEGTVNTLDEARSVAFLHCVKGVRKTTQV